jgi:hypothetical protein
MNSRKGTLEKLFTDAKRFETDTSGLEDHFEHRLMARIRERKSPAWVWFSWQRRLTPVFLLLTIILGIVTWYIEAHRCQDLIPFLIDGREISAAVTDFTGVE